MFVYLPADLRAVIEAIYQDGLSVRQAALRLGITQHKVHTRHTQALRIIEREIRAVVTDGDGI